MVNKNRSFDLGSVSVDTHECCKNKNKINQKRIIHFHFHFLSIVLWSQFHSIIYLEVMEKALKHRFQPISDEYIKVMGSGFTRKVKIEIFGCMIQ